MNRRSTYDVWISTYGGTYSFDQIGFDAKPNRFLASRKTSCRGWCLKRCRPADTRPVADWDSGAPLCIRGQSPWVCLSGVDDLLILNLRDFPAFDYICVKSRTMRWARRLNVRRTGRFDDVSRMFRPARHRRSGYDGNLMTSHNFSSSRRSN